MDLAKTHGDVARFLRRTSLHVGQLARWHIPGLSRFGRRNREGRFGWITRVRLTHPQFSSLRLNLFLPFRDGKRERLSARVSRLIGDDSTIDRLVFEWVPPGHLLGEIAGERPVP